MPVYSPEFREAITARMLPPNNESMNSLARESGVCLTTLRKWKQKALGEAALQERAEGRAGSLPSLSRKFRIAFESAGLSDEELAAYARSKGLHVEQIKEYRRDCLQADALLSKLEKEHRLESQALEERLRAAEAEKKVLNKTVVEPAALVTLAKKINAI